MSFEECQSVVADGSLALLVTPLSDARCCDEAQKTKCVTNLYVNDSFFSWMVATSVLFYFLRDGHDT